MNNIPYLINADTFQDFEDISINVKEKRLYTVIRKMQDLDLKIFLGHPLYYQFIKYCSNSGWATAQISTNTTSAADGTYRNRAIVATSGSGVNGEASFVVAGGIVTAIAQTALGVKFAVGDTFTSAAVPGAVFTVLSLSPELTFDPATPEPFLDLYNGVEYLDKRGNEILYEGMIPTLVYFAFARFIESDPIRFTATGAVQKHADNSDALSLSDKIKLVQQQRSVANAHANEVNKYLYDHRGDFVKWMLNQKNASSRQAGPRIRGIDRTNFNYPNGGNGYNDGFNGIGISDLI